VIVLTWQIQLRILRVEIRSNRRKQKLSKKIFLIRRVYLRPSLPPFVWQKPVELGGEERERRKGKGGEIDFIPSQQQRTIGIVQHMPFIHLSPHPDEISGMLIVPHTML